MAIDDAVELVATVPPPPPVSSPIGNEKQTENVSPSSDEESSVSSSDNTQSNYEWLADYFWYGWSYIYGTHDTPDTVVDTPEEVAVSAPEVVEAPTLEASPEVVENVPTSVNTVEAWTVDQILEESLKTAAFGFVLVSTIGLVEFSRDAARETMIAEREAAKATIAPISQKSSTMAPRSSTGAPVINAANILKTARANAEAEKISTLKSTEGVILGGKSGLGTNATALKAKQTVRANQSNTTMRFSQMEAVATRASIHGAAIAAAMGGVVLMDGFGRRELPDVSPALITGCSASIASAGAMIALKPSNIRSSLGRAIAIGLVSAAGVEYNKGKPLYA